MQKKDWIEYANSGAEFIKNHCIDTDGIMFFLTTREGQPLRKRRYFYSESFLVVGFAEYYLVSKNPSDLELSEKYFELFKKIHEYSFSHFADEKHGEWYGYLHRDGSVSHTQKGSLWKGLYHLPRCLILVEKILESLEFNKDLPDLL